MQETNAHAILSEAPLYRDAVQWEPRDSNADATAAALQNSMLCSIVSPTAILCLVSLVSPLCNLSQVHRAAIHMLL